MSDKVKTYLDVANIYKPEGLRRNKKDGSKLREADPESLDVIRGNPDDVITINSVREASQKTGIYEGSIRKVCEGNRQSAHGYIWRYVDEEEAKKHQKPKNQLEFDFDLVED